VEGGVGSGQGIPLQRILPVQMEGEEAGAIVPARRLIVRLLPEVRAAYDRLPEEDQRALGRLTPEMIQFYGTLPVSHQVAILDLMPGHGAMVVELLRQVYQFAMQGNALEGPAPAVGEGALVPAGPRGGGRAGAEPAIRIDPALLDLLRGTGADGIAALAAFFARASDDMPEAAARQILAGPPGGPPVVEPDLAPAGPVPGPMDGPAPQPPAPPERVGEGLAPAPPDRDREEALLAGPRPAPGPQPAARGIPHGLGPDALRLHAVLLQEYARAQRQAAALAGAFEAHRPRVPALLENLEATMQVLLGSSPEAQGPLDQIRARMGQVPDRLDQMAAAIAANRERLAEDAEAVAARRAPRHDVTGLVNGVRDAVGELRNVFTEIAGGARSVAGTSRSVGEVEVALNFLTVAREAVLETEVIPGPDAELMGPFRIRDEVVTLAKRVKRGFAKAADLASQANDVLLGLGLGTVAVADVIVAAEAGAEAGFLGSAGAIVGFAAGGVALFFGIVALGLAQHRISRGEEARDRLHGLRGRVSEGRSEDTRAYAERQKESKVALAKEGRAVGAVASGAAVLALVATGLVAASVVTGPGAIVVGIVVGIVGITAAVVSVWATFFRSAEARQEAAVLMEAARHDNAAGQAARDRIAHYVGYGVGLEGGELRGEQGRGPRRIARNLRGSGTLKDDVAQRREQMAQGLVEMLVRGTDRERVEAEMVLTALGMDAGALHHQATEGGREDAVRAEVANKLKP